MACQPWSVRVDAGADGPTNMAADHALVRSARRGRAFLRLYGWDPPTLSLGRNEPGLGRYDLEQARARGIGIVRRPTGGRAVLHGREVTYAVAAPIRFFGGLRDAYHAINRALLSGLERLGIGVDLAGGSDVPSSPDNLRLDRGACFLNPAPGEIVAGGRKLVGSAQVRVGDALLQHGSILLEDDQGLVELLSNTPREERSHVPPTTASLAGLLGEAPTRDIVCEAVVAGFQETFEGRWASAREPLDLPPDLLERYRSAEWTWRR